MSYTERLAATYGTEKDRVHCPFYYKIGACRHGDRCSRQHNKPTMSPTIIIPNMYQTPAQQFQLQTGQPPPFIDPKQAEEHLLDFYEDVSEELGKFGELEEMYVCNNLGDHLTGNVYAKFRDEDGAAAAQQALHGRFYAKRPLICEFSPVTDFREARCRQFDHGECTRGGYCNFMHMYKIPYEVERRIFGNRRQPPSPPRRRGGGRRDYAASGGGGTSAAPYERRSYQRSRSPPSYREYDRRESYSRSDRGSRRTPDRYEDRYADRGSYSYEDRSYGEDRGSYDDRGYAADRSSRPPPPPS